MDQQTHQSNPVNKTNPLNINFDIINIKMLKDEPVKSVQSISQLNSNLARNKSKLNNSYIATKYLGDVDNAKLFLLKSSGEDEKNDKFVCKQIQVDNPELRKQIKFEIDLLKYLSFKRNTMDHINPCIDSAEDRATNTFLTIFPVFNGSSLQRYKQHMMKELDPTEYQNLAMLLTKSILLGLAAIHHNHIAHQNINENTILISSNDVSNLAVKFTDFGLGCGKYFRPPNDTDIFFRMCNIADIPVKIRPDILEKLGSSQYLDISIKNDIWRLGLILLGLLLPNEAILADNGDKLFAEGWSKSADDSVFKPILGKYVDQSATSNSRFPEYLRQIIGNMLRPMNERKTCKYVADKIIVFEKYLGEDFSD